MQKVSIFVDVQNIYYTTKEFHNCHFDYNAFWSRATSNRQVVKAIAYAIYKADEKQKQFQNILRGIGFEIKLKPFIQRSDGSAKGDWDVGITLDVMEYARESDVIILASGDGDFDLLINKVKNNLGVQVEVYGVPQFTADSLISSASKFIPIENELLLKPKSNGNK
ncbi:MAG TPA: NYN domain-containing protein [Ignavibacteriaceae bacterium]|nr:NYN domain-containing protein [Ignavibacteriaceae bacterium]